MLIKKANFGGILESQGLESTLKSLLITPLTKNIEKKNEIVELKIVETKKGAKKEKEIIEKVPLVAEIKVYDFDAISVILLFL